MQSGKGELGEATSSNLLAQITILVTFLFSIGNGVGTGLLPFVDLVVSTVIRAGTRSDSSTQISSAIQVQGKLVCVIILLLLM